MATKLFVRSRRRYCQVTSTTVTVPHTCTLNRTSSSSTTDFRMISTTTTISTSIKINSCICSTERRLLSMSDLSSYPSSFHPQRRVVQNSRRYFFSIFNNNENDTNIDEKDTKNTMRSNINKKEYDDDDRWENKYRTSITTTSDEINEFRHESQRTRHHLPDADDIKREIQDNINNIWTRSTSSSPPPE